MLPKNIRLTMPICRESDGTSYIKITVYDQNEVLYTVREEVKAFPSDELIAQLSLFGGR